MSHAPRLRGVLPEPTAEHDPATADGRAWIDAQYRADPPIVRLNMVTTLTGSAVGPDGTSDSISNRTDRAILAAIRRAADVVVVGAQTVRAEEYRLPRDLVLAVVTSTGDLGAEVLARSDPEDRRRLLLVTGSDSAARVRERAAEIGCDTVVAGPGDRPSPAEIVATLRERGLVRIVCEGGPGLASQFVSAGVVDELCVTVAPMVGARAEPFLALDHGPDADVAAMLVDERGFSYLRLRPRS